MQFKFVIQECKNFWTYKLNIPWQNDLHVEAAEQEKVGDAKAGNAGKRPSPTPATKPDVPESGTNAGEPDRSDSDESDDSVWQTASWRWNL